MRLKITKKRLQKEATPTDIDVNNLKKVNKKEFIKKVAIEKKPKTKQIGNTKQRKGWNKLFKKKLDEINFYEVKQPLLLLIRSSGNIDTFEDVPDGAFNIEGDNKKTKKKEKTGSEVENRTKTIILDNQKLLNLPYGFEEKTKQPYNIRMWIAYEDEATSYPNEVMHDSSILFTFIRRIFINAGLLEKEKGDNAKMLFWLKMIAGIAIAGYLLWKMGLFDGAMVSSTTSVATNEIKNITAQQALQVGVQ